MDCVRSGRQAGLREGFEAEVARLLDRARGLMASEGAAEGMRSFIERRAGMFQAR